MSGFDKAYWEKRWENKETGWDIGYPSPPLKEYIDTLKDKSIRILIPGAGNAYEAEYLHQKGFVNTFIVDIAGQAIKNFLKRYPSFPPSQALEEDFFVHTGQYDLILEQTFFCALLPSFRERYVKKIHELLVNGGKLAGVLFNCKLNKDHPPFGGDITEYTQLFSPYFSSLKISPCYNSILPRQGQEVFITAIK